MKLSSKAKDKLTDEVVMNICLEINKSYHTFKRWVKISHDNLTRISTINAIVKHTGLMEEEIFETELQK